MIRKYSEIPVRDLFDIPLHAITMEEVLNLVDETIRSRGSLHIGVVNAAKVVNMHKDAFLRQAVISSDIILADGMSVVWASRLLRRPLPERVSGIDLMMGMFACGNKQRYRIYCLGATDEVLEKVREEIGIRYPNVIVTGSRNGYFTEDQEEEVAKSIASTRSDILLVAITSPKKEKFLAKWSNVIGVSVCHGVGGSFDVMAGKVQRAPEIWQRIGLEWLYRLKQEPGRLWRRYLETNTFFVWLLIRQFFRKKSTVVRESEHK